MTTIETWDLPADVDADRYSTRAAADITGLTTHTLRWYEKVGVVPHVERSSTGQRCYSEANIRWIRLVRRLRATGMSVKTLQELAENLERGDAHRVFALIRRHRTQVLQQARQLYSDLADLDDLAGTLPLVLPGEQRDAS